MRLPRQQCELQVKMNVGLGAAVTLMDRCEGAEGGGCRWVSAEGAGGAKGGKIGG